MVKKDFKDLFFLQYQWTDFHASGTPAIIVCSNDDPGLTLTDLRASEILELRFFYRKKGKTVDLFETIAVCDLNVGRSRQLDEYVSSQGQGPFLTLAQCLILIQIKMCSSQKPLDIFDQILYVSF